MSTSGSKRQTNKQSRCVRVDPHRVAAPFRQGVRQALADLEFVPRLVGFLATDNRPSLIYARVTARTLKADGILFELRQLGRHELEEALEGANQDPAVHGIIVYYPVFGGEQDSYLREIVSLEKDVEGLSSRYRYNLYHNIRFMDRERTRKSIIPCTPLAVVKTLEHHRIYRPGAPVGEQLADLSACVVNRSEVVGRPLAAMLAHDGATVYSVDIDGVLIYRGQRVAECELSAAAAVKQADLLVTAVPDPDYGPLGPDDVKPGVAVIDLSSLNNVSPDITRVASLYCSNVGPVTVAMVERNLVRLLENFRSG